jgi:hypothetical protein
MKRGARNDANERYMHLTLTRTHDGGVRTLGQLTAGAMTFATIERPWIEDTNGPGGMPRQSCVPRGVYALDRWDSARFPKSFILINPDLGVYRQPGDIPRGQAWGRSSILIHQGNRVQDVIGCIAVGMEQGQLQGEPAVLRSVPALLALVKMLGRSKHVLEIL